MIAWLVVEVRRRLSDGEPLESVVPSLVDLFYGLNIMGLRTLLVDLFFEAIGVVL